MAYKEIVFKREALYEEIWMTPIVRLAKEYGISDVALAKICKKLNVPRPPRGYWAKLEFNKKVHKPPLPAVSAGDPTEFVHHEYSRQVNETPLDPGIRESILVKRNIIVPANLDNPHRLVKETMAVLKHVRKSTYGMLERDIRACLEVNVSPACLDRALRIMNAAVRGFEAEGIVVVTEEGLGNSTYARIDNEKIYFAISEGYRRIDHVPTQEELSLKKKRPFWEITKYDYQPTGELSLRIVENGGYGCRKKWLDSKSGRLEEKIGDFIGGAILVAHSLKIERKAKEEADRKREIERKEEEVAAMKWRDEEARLQKLEQQASLWAKSEQLRAFVLAVAKVVAAKKMSENARKGYEDWMTWAKKHADKIDPIIQSFPEEKGE